MKVNVNSSTQKQASVASASASASAAAADSAEFQALAKKMGGQDGYANAGSQFNATSFGSNKPTERAFIRKLENELGYQNLTNKNGQGRGAKWTQAKADQNIDTLAYGLQQLQAQGLVDDGKLTRREVNQLDLDTFLKSPISGGSKPDAGQSPIQQPAPKLGSGSSANRDIASKMGGQDNYAGAGHDFEKAPFSSTTAAQKKFISKLENELGYDNLAHKDGTGKGTPWTQAGANKNLDILTYGLDQLQAQGLTTDGRLTEQDVSQLRLNGPTTAPKAPVNQGSNSGENDIFFLNDWDGNDVDNQNVSRDWERYNLGNDFVAVHDSKNDRNAPAGSLGIEAAASKIAAQSKQGEVYVAMGGESGQMKLLTDAVERKGGNLSNVSVVSHSTWNEETGNGQFANNKRSLADLRSSTNFIDQLYRPTLSTLLIKMKKHIFAEQPVISLKMSVT